MYTIRSKKVKCESGTSIHPHKYFSVSSWSQGQFSKNSHTSSRTAFKERLL